MNVNNLYSILLYREKHVNCILWFVLKYNEHECMAKEAQKYKKIEFLLMFVKFYMLLVM